MPKDFLTQINDMIAASTRAWIDFEIATVTVDHEGFATSNDNEMAVDVRVILKKKGKSVTNP